MVLREASHYDGARKRKPIGSFYMSGKQLELSMLFTLGDSTRIRVDCELPDAIYGFKSCSVDLDTMAIISRRGFSDEEMSFVIDRIDENQEVIRDFAVEG